jgi:hypothetical protein
MFTNSLFFFPSPSSPSKRAKPFREAEWSDFS